MNKIIILLLFVFSLANGLNLRPIVGVIAQPHTNGEYFGPAVQSIVASYVKWLESAGARVVPIFYNSSRDDLTALFNNINGIVFPGGGQFLNPGQPFYDASLFLYNLAVEANNKGDYFPLWGTCQGFQFLNIVASTIGNESALTAYNSWDYSWPLDFTPISKSSRMFGNAPSYIYDILANENVTMNWHHWGISPDLYKTDSKLASFYDILSTNVDINGKPFVSSIEGKNTPFYATQFHPEWSIFEWDPTADVSHTTDAVAAMSYIAQFFVSETRKSNHQFPNPVMEMNALIYNYAPNYTEIATGDVQTYFF